MSEKIDGAADPRTANNVVRHEHRVLSDAEKASVQDIKDRGLAFIVACQEIGKSRELALAITNAEMAVMWAVKHITR